MGLRREGRTGGRWPNYSLYLDDVYIGSITRTLTSGGDLMTPTVRYDGWEIPGVIAESRESAEQQLIERHRRRATQ